MTEKSKLEEDQLVSKLVPDPAQGPPNAVTLHGYLGKGATAGNWRLYVTPALDEYAEIPEAEILHSQKLPDEQGTIVWVPKSLKLSYVRVHSDEVQAGFLGGAITQTRLQGAPGAAVPPPRPHQPSFVTICSDITVCPSFQPCILSHAPCPSIPCPSVEARCPSQTPCPTVTPPCMVSITLPACPTHPVCHSINWACQSIPVWHCPTHRPGCHIFEASFTVACPTPTAHASALTICPSQNGPCGTGGATGGDPVE